MEKNREQVLHEWLLTLHIFCFLIMLAVILQYISASSHLGLAHYVPYTLPILTVLFIAEIFLLYYVDYQGVRHFQDAAVVLYIAFPFLIAAGVLYMAGNNIPTARIILLLPVLVTGSIAGKKAVNWAVLLSILIIVGIDYQSLEERAWQGFLDRNFVIISTIVVTGFFSGAISDLEASQRRQLLNAKQRMTDIINFLPDATFAIDLEGKIVTWNRAMEELTGLKADEIIGRGDHEYSLPFYSIRRKLLIDFMLHPDELDDLTEVKSLYTSVLKIPGALVAETFSPFIGNTGTFFWTKATTLYDENGEIVGAIESLKDISEIKHLEQEMARMDRLNLVGEMAASIAHEIRNPMTTVRGMLQLMSEKSGYKDDSEIFYLMIEELDRANTIIAEYLSLARNKMADFQSSNLKSIIEAVHPLIMAKAMFLDKNVVLDLQEVPDLMLDEKEIRQLLLNLVSNGLEAMSPGGTLTIRSCVTPSCIVLAVEDQGHGISSEMLERLGQPFLTTKEHGTGLGLSVCFSIAARHNAEIDVQTSSQGTCFIVRFNL